MPCKVYDLIIQVAGRKGDSICPKRKGEFRKGGSIEKTKKEEETRV